MKTNKNYPQYIFSGSINMIIGGTDSNDDYNSDAQIVNLSNETRTCNNFPDYPIAMSYATGAIVQGQPIVCGGLSYPNYYSECYKYSKGTSISDVRFFLEGGSVKQNWTKSD